MIKQNRITESKETYYKQNIQPIIAPIQANLESEERTSRRITNLEPIPRGERREQEERV